MKRRLWLAGLGVALQRPEHERPGGTYRVRVPQGHTALGEFTELDPPRRVVFRWGWEGHDTVPPGSTIVEVTLVPDDDVRLVHTGLLGPGEVAQHTQGWDRYLDRLVIAAGGGDPGPDVAEGQPQPPR